MDKMENDDLNGLLDRMRFKPLQYDIELNYKQLQEKIEQKEVVAFKDRRFQVWRLVGIAASLALLIMTTMFLVNLKSGKEMIWYEITAVPDAKTKVILPDNSTVWLNANASLDYPRSFDGNTRNVRVSGDAMFEVTKDKTKPFFVELDGLKIKVLGTVFNVITDKRENEIEITLLEGKIGLFDSNNLTDVPNKILMPNERAIFHKSNNNILVSSVEVNSVTSWITGNFVFNGNTLDEISVELERAFHTKIHIDNVAMKEKTFNAVFDNKETLDEILSILQISARYKIEKRKGEIYIY